jgi:hypothetical protein
MPLARKEWQLCVCAVAQRGCKVGGHDTGQVSKRVFQTEIRLLRHTRSRLLRLRPIASGFWPNRFPQWLRIYHWQCLKGVVYVHSGNVHATSVEAGPLYPVRISYGTIIAHVAGDRGTRPAN